MCLLQEAPTILLVGERCSNVQQLANWVLQFKSPKYPFYQPNQDPCWSVTVAKGNKVEVLLIDFAVSHFHISPCFVLFNRAF